MSKRAIPAFVALLASCAPSTGVTPPPPPPPAPPFAVQDGAIVDDVGRVVTLYGMNVSGNHKMPPFLDFHTQADLEMMRQRWGMNSMRFLVSWGGLMPQRGVVDEAYLAQIVERMDWAQAAGVLVVLDMHQDVFGLGFLGGNGAPRWACDESHYAAFVPNPEWYLNYLSPEVVACFDHLWADTALQDEYARAWAALAAALADHPAVVGFDIMNEPFVASYPLETFEYEALQPFYERVVPAVRAHAPHWLAFVEPKSLRNLFPGSSFVPFSFGNVVYAPHSYDSAAERGMGFDEAHAQALRDNILLLKAEADNIHAALWLGEFGALSGRPGVGPYMQATVDALDEVGAGGSIWTFTRGDGYDVMDMDGNEKGELLDVLVRPVPRRTWACREFRFDRATRSYTFQCTGPTRGAETVALPTRVYPDGVDVVCTGCTWTHQDGELAVTVAGSTAVTVTVTPR